MKKQANKYQNKEEEIIFDNIDNKSSINNTNIIKKKYFIANNGTYKLNKNKKFSTNHLLLSLSKNVLYSFLKIYFLFTLIISISSHLSLHLNNNDRKLKLYFSEITMEIMANSGEQKVISPYYYQFPDEIYLDNIKMQKKIAQ